MEPQRVFIALGANLGDRLESLERACDALHETYGALRLSQLYETEPVGCPAGAPSFLNACVELYTDESPQQVLARCQQIESLLGRQRSGVYGEPRSCDLDVVSYGELILHDEALTLPHPRAHERTFVLQPLCDLDADLLLAGQTRRVTDLLAHLEDEGHALPTVFPL